MRQLWTMAVVNVQKYDVTAPSYVMVKIYYLIFSVFYKLNLKLKPFFGTEVMLSGFMVSTYISSLLYLILFTVDKYVVHSNLNELNIAKLLFMILTLKTYEVAFNRKQIQERLSFLNSYSEKKIKTYYAAVIILYAVFGLLCYFSEPRQMPIRIY